MKKTTHWILLAAIAGMAMADLRAQAMRAVTSAPGPSLHVVATWPPDAVVRRFNLYRKAAAAPGFPAAPLNPQPIERMTNCATIQATIPPGSDDWTALAKGLAPNALTDFDPCAISTVVPGSPQDARLQFLARSRASIAVVAGLAYDDKAVVSATAYAYELRGVDAIGNETGTLFTNVTVTAGSPVAIPAPGGLTATAGDSRVLLLWGAQPDAAGFAVLRGLAAAGPYVRVNEAVFLAKVQQDLNGNTIPSSNGFLDLERWDGSGAATTHLVNGVPIDGPYNGTKYFYKVASVDLLGQSGPPSATPAFATPLDRTPPAAPSGVSVHAVDSENRLEVRWNIVQADIDGHQESAALGGYRLYRYTGENAPLASGTQIGGVIPPPAPGTTFVVASDNAPILRPPFGEQTFWYRVETFDASGNVSARSAAAGGHLKDITPPAPPKGIAAEGFDDFIRVTWKPNTEPDLDGYQIYRGMCHNGVSNPCTPRQPGLPGLPASDSGKLVDSKTPCTGEYVLVGSISAQDAAAMGATITFDDHSVPKGSPLCYSYWVKAVDKAQNKSGSWPFPDPATEKTVCQRLRDRTPPDPAIISGLFARDHAIRVEWIGPPVQDIRAYHVYRSENENGPYRFVGGMTVELPPAVPQILLTPYKAPPVVGCDKIPLTIIDTMSMGFFVDTTVDQKTIYWYKVVGIDQSGNEAPLAKAVGVSTFTFTTALPETPAVTSVTGTTTSPFALVIRWTPAFDPAQQRGFAVFRSDRVDGLYRQVGSLLNASEYQDNQVVRGVAYWYKVAKMDLTGQVSLPSAPVSGVLP